MKTLPPGLVVYRRTREFDQDTLPAGLRSRHSTKPGVWGRICIRQGALRYRILEPELEEHLLSPEAPGIVEPGVPHEVEPVGEVLFWVEFLRAPP